MPDYTTVGVPEQLKGTILLNLLRSSDADLAVVLPHIRDENGERLVSVLQLRHMLRREARELMMIRPTGRKVSEAAEADLLREDGPEWDTRIRPVC